MASLVLICALGALAGLVFAISAFICIGLVAAVVITRIKFWAIQQQRKKTTKDSVFSWKTEPNTVATSPDIQSKHLEQGAIQNLVNVVPKFLEMKALSGEASGQKVEANVPNDVESQSSAPAPAPEPTTIQDESTNKGQFEDQSLLDVLADLPNIATLAKRQVSRSLEVERVRETGEDEVLIEISESGDLDAEKVDISARKRSRRISLDWLPAPSKNANSSSQVELLSDVDEGSEGVDDRELDVEEGRSLVVTDDDVMPEPEYGFESPTFDLRLRDPRVKEIFESYDNEGDARSNNSDEYTSVLSVRFHGRDSQDSVNSRSGLLGRVEAPSTPQTTSRSSHQGIVQRDDDVDTFTRVPARRAARKSSIVRANVESNPPLQEYAHQDSCGTVSSRSEESATPKSALRKKIKQPKYVSQDSFNSVSSDLTVPSTPVKKVQIMDGTNTGRSSPQSISDVSTVSSTQKLRRAVRTISEISATSDESLERIPGAALVRPTKKKSSSPPNSSRTNDRRGSVGSRQDKEGKAHVKEKI